MNIHQELYVMNGLAEALELPDGQRPCEYYLLEALCATAKHDHYTAREALLDALPQAQGRRRSYILHACKALKKGLRNV